MLHQTPTLTLVCRFTYFVGYRNGSAGTWVQFVVFVAFMSGYDVPSYLSGA